VRIPRVVPGDIQCLDAVHVLGASLGEFTLFLFQGEARALFARELELLGGEAGSGCRLQVQVVADEECAQDDEMCCFHLFILAPFGTDKPVILAPIGHPLEEGVSLGCGQARA
jgi:hypothetical protein